MAETLRFKVIEGGNQKRKYAARNKADAEQWVCRMCEAEIGVATSAIIKIKESPMVRAGKLEGGSDVWVCAHCLMRGKIMRVT